MMASETELEAGRELDALIAENVMADDFGEKADHDWGDTWDVDDNPSKAYYCRRCWAYADEHLSGPCIEDPPPYSTDIAAAWKVVVNLGLAVIPVAGGFLAGRFNDTFAPTYISDEDGVIDGRMDQYAKAETAPLAICRAALAAMPDAPSAS